MLILAFFAAAFKRSLLFFHCMDLFIVPFGMINAAMLLLSRNDAAIDLLPCLPSFSFTRCILDQFIEDLTFGFRT